MRKRLERGAKTLVCQLNPASKKWRVGMLPPRIKRPRDLIRKTDDLADMLGVLRFCDHKFGYIGARDDFKAWRALKNFIRRPDSKTVNVSLRQALTL